MEATNTKSNMRGWVSYIAVFIMCCFTFAIISGTHTIYNPENMERLGVSTAVYMAPVGMTTVLTALAGIAYPFMERLFTPKGCMGIGTILCSACFVVLGLSKSMTGIWIGYIMLGFGYAQIFVHVWSTITDSWFAVNKGTMASILGAASNLSTTLWTNLTRKTINMYGWQKSYFIWAAVVLVVAGIAWIFVVNKPSDVGCDPIWIEKAKAADLEEKTEINRVPVGVAIANIFKKKKLILAVICAIIIGFMFHPISQCFTNIMASKEFLPETIAAMLGIYYLVLGIAKFISGIITDHIGVKWTLLIILAFAFVGLILLYTIQPGNTTVGYLVACLLGYAGSCTTFATACMIMAAVPEHDYYVTTISVIVFVYSVCQTIATILYSAMYDKFGSYNPVVKILLVLDIILIILSLIFSKGMVALNKRDKKN